MPASVTAAAPRYHATSSSRLINRLVVILAFSVLLSLAGTAVSFAAPAPAPALAPNAEPKGATATTLAKPKAVAPVETKKPAKAPPTTSDYLKDELDGKSDAAPAAAGFLGTLGRLIVALVVVTGLIYLAVWLLKRFGVGGMIPQGRKGNLIRSISSTTIGTQHSIHLIDVGGKVLLVGLFEKGMTLLAEIDDADTLARIEEEIGQSEESFAELLANGQVKGVGRLPSGAAAGSPKEWLQDKIDALRQMTARTAGGYSGSKSRPSRKSAAPSKVVSSQSEDRIKDRR